MPCTCIVEQYRIEQNGIEWNGVCIASLLVMWCACAEFAQEGYAAAGDKGRVLRGRLLAGGAHQCEGAWSTTALYCTPHSLLPPGGGTITILLYYTILHYTIPHYTTLSYTLYRQVCVSCLPYCCILIAIKSIHVVHSLHQ